MELPVNYSQLHWKDKQKVRKEYIKLQKGLCCHCGEPLNDEPAEKIKNMKVNRELFPSNFFKWPIHLHHSHKTDLTIGAVHSYCNAVLWQYHGE